MPTYKSENRRRNYFIEKKFQTRFISRFYLPVIFTALISAIVIYRFSSQSTVTVFENSRLVIKAGTEFIIPGLILSTLISVILVGIATMIIMLFMSHRIAGPLYKIENSLKRMANGDLSFDVHFRSKDEFKKLAEAFNMTSQRLSSMLGDVKGESARLNSIINDVKTLAEKSPVEAEGLRQAIKKLGDLNKQLDEKLIKFRLR